MTNNLNYRIERYGEYKTTEVNIAIRNLEVEINFLKSLIDDGASEE
ncbi:hypothetical protein [Clostridium acidisoli]|nr:hypothetical protein [Clostridium acidisoli]